MCDLNFQTKGSFTGNRQKKARKPVCYVFYTNFTPGKKAQNPNTQIMRFFLGVKLG